MIKQAITTALLIVSILLCTSATAQPGWQWGKRGGGGSGSGEGEVEMVTDRKGNLYVLAKVAKASGANIDGFNSTNMNDQVSLTKWDCNGNRKWTKFFGAPHVLFTFGNSLGMDTLGGIYFTGVTTAGGYFDADTTLPANIEKPWFIVKYDTSGNFQWLRMPQADTVTGAFGTAGKSVGIALDVAPNGDIYVLSRLAQGIFAGSYVTTSAGIHLLKFNQHGNFVNGHEVDITVSSDATGLQTRNLTEYSTGFAREHNSGRFYLTGVYHSDFGSLTFGSTPVISSGVLFAIPMYIAAFDSLGNHLWMEQSTPSKPVNGMYGRPRLDENGNIFLCGEASNESGHTFLGHSFYNNVQSGRPPQFIMSVNKNGTLNWAKNIQSYSGDIGAVAYADGIVYATGWWQQKIVYGSDTLTAPVTESKGYLSMSNSYTGSLVRIDTFGVNGPGFHMTDVIAAPNGKVYVGGALSNKVFLPFVTLSKLGGTFDFFVAKYGSANCNCTLPLPDFSYSSASGSTSVSFTYTGGTPVDSIRWEFGDGAMTSGLTASHAYTSPGSYGVSIVVYSDCGVQAFYKDITTGTSTGITAPGLDAGVVIYPNPAHQQIKLYKVSAGTQIMLHNTIGQQVLTHTAAHDNETIDISSLHSGIYMIVLTTKDGKRGGLRFVKE